MLIIIISDFLDNFLCFLFSFPAINTITEGSDNRNKVIHKFLIFCIHLVDHNNLNSTPL